MGFCSDGLRSRCCTLHRVWSFSSVVSLPVSATKTLKLTMHSSGFQLWKIFLALDSDRYPMKSYADPFFRIYGKWARLGVNLLQSLQLLLTVAALILSNGQSISQVSKGNLCFIACLVIFMAAGMILGQIRTLQRFGWLANFAVWLNLLILFIWSVSPSYH
jgi:hypothetical protein